LFAPILTKINMNNKNHPIQPLIEKLEDPKLNINIEITDTNTGEITSGVWKDWEWHQFWWEEGNASCDCNREIFFNRFKGIELEYDTECGDNRYKVKITNNDTGEILYNET
jgi:hypothetical protein